MRIDKWLWFARVVKTRALAQKLVSAGKLRINRRKISTPSHKVTIGDTLTIRLEQSVVIYAIAGLAERRRAFPLARMLYVDHTATKQ